MSNIKPLGKRLKLARIAKDLTQEELAILTKMRQKAISRYERGECWPSIPTLIKLCNVLEINASDLLEGDKC